MRWKPGSKCWSYEAAVRTVRLRDIAHARAGDKGDTSNISLWVRDPADYLTVKAQVTPERVADAFAGLLNGLCNKQVRAQSGMPLPEIPASPETRGNGRAPLGPAKT